MSNFSFGAHALVERGAHIDAHRFQRGGAVGSELVEERVEGGGSLLDVVVDFSFWQRARREHDKRLIEDVGGWWRLLYLKVDPALLRRRLDGRSRRFDANVAFPIS